MTNFIQCMFSKSRRQIILFLISRGKIRCSTRSYACKSCVTSASGLRCVHPTIGHCHHQHISSSYQRMQIMKSSIHTGIPLFNNKDDKKWNRKVTIMQFSKADQKKLLTFDVSVLDTYPDDVDQKRKTVVAIHGIPGASDDFESLAATLFEKGIRLVAPTSLGMTASPISLDHLSDVDFSSEGRARTFQLILTAMGIQRIDMLVAHSAGAWTLYEAGSKWTNIGSLLCVNPVGAKPHRTLRPFLLLKFIAYSLLWWLGRLIILPFIPFVYSRLGFKGITLENNGINLITAQQYVTKGGLYEVPDKAELIRRKKLPVVFAYSLNDRLIEPSIYADMAYNVLGIPDENTVTYADDKTPSKDPLFVPEGWLTRCLVFARGGHIVHVAHEKEIVDQIESVLEYVERAKH